MTDIVKYVSVLVGVLFIAAILVHLFGTLQVLLAVVVPAVGLLMAYWYINEN